MAIKFINPKSHRAKKPYIGECEILADSAAEIEAMKETVSDGRITAKPMPGSIAYTADMSAIYQLSPSGEWTKAGV